MATVFELFPQPIILRSSTTQLTLPTHRTMLFSSPDFGTTPMRWVTSVSTSLNSIPFPSISCRKQHTFKRKVWQQKEALHVTTSCTKAILDSEVLPKLKEQIYCSSAGVDLSPNFETKDFAVPRRKAMALIFSSYIFSQVGFHDIAFALPSVPLREYIDTFDGYSFKYPQNWIPVRGAGADIFFRDPYILDENLSVEFSSPSSSSYKSVEDLGSPQEAAKKVLKQYLTEFMSTRLGVRRESNVVATSSRVADDGKLYYEVEVNIKSYASNNELAVNPQDRVVRMEWDRRYLSVLGVENSRLYELRLQTPENVFIEEENDLRRVMESFRVNKVAA